MNAEEARVKLLELASPEIAASSARFYKTGPGEYAEGDQFLGVKVPVLRKLAREFRTLPLYEVEKLLASKNHEERLLALLLLVQSVGKCTDDYRKTVYELYLKNTHRVNNWDLVDSSAPAIVGGYLVDKPRKPLYQLVKSVSLWERRIAIIATQHFIRQNDFADTLALAEILLKDAEDLIHKATGWMLREVGQRDLQPLVVFLDEHAAVMPRTMLRYAIEHFAVEKRQHYLQLGRQPKR